MSFCIQSLIFLFKTHSSSIGGEWVYWDGKETNGGNQTGANFRGGKASIPRDGINIVMTDLAQWLDIFVAFMHRNYTHTCYCGIEFRNGERNFSCVCITFRKKTKSN